MYEERRCEFNGLDVTDIPIQSPVWGCTWDWKRLFGTNFLVPRRMTYQYERPSILKRIRDFWYLIGPGCVQANKDWRERNEISRCKN